MPVLTAADENYFLDIRGHYASGARLVPVIFASAKEATCHENADLFFHCHPDYPPVRGWLVAELGNAPGYFRLVAHSANRAPGGTFIDVTPLREEDRRAYRFISHQGAEDGYSRLAALWPDLIFPVVDVLALFNSVPVYDDGDEGLHLLP